MYPSLTTFVKTLNIFEAHICVFFHPDDKINGDIDRIDQMMWAEVPINFQSKEFDEYLDTWRHADDDRTQFWRVKEVEMKKVTLPFLSNFFLFN